MKDEVRATVLEVTRASDASSISFPGVVGKLVEAGVERYHADLVRAEKTYYLPNGESEVVSTEPVRAPLAAQFSAAGVDAAVRASQAGAITYHEFCERVLAAGCVAYVVSIVGRRAMYYGRSGETHTELFPGSR
jgi:uncharacterized protein YbcV (DUF1398 family)